MPDYEELVRKLKARYGDYLMQKEFCMAAGICPKTAYKLTKSGEIPYERVIDGHLHYYRIRAGDVAAYMVRRSAEHEIPECNDLVTALEIILGTEPDVVSVKHAALITGMHKNTVLRWVTQKKLNAVISRGENFIPKKELIVFMRSDIFWKARSCSLQREVVRAFSLWYQKRTEDLRGRYERN